eukprot:59526-Chlamydomonas_euryale.AAC.1
MTGTVPTKLSFSCGDNREFAAAVQLARRRTMDEVKAMMRPPVTLDQAVARVQEQVCGPCEHRGVGV